MHEGHVIGVAVVVDALEKITRPNFGGGHFEDAVLFHVRIARKRRRFSRAEVGEDQSQVFPRWTISDADLGREGFIFSGLFGALTGAVKQPAVIHTTDAVAFHRAGGKLRAAVRTAESDDVRRAGFTTVQRKLLAHNLDRPGFAGAQLFGAIDGLPEPAHVVAGERSRLGRNEILKAQFRFGAAAFAFS